MTIQKRPDNTIFAESALVGEVKPFPDIGRGFGIDFDINNGLPEMTGFNGLMQLVFQNMAYILQNGFSEWDAAETYPAGAGVRVGLLWYKARRDNTGKQPNLSQNDWQPVLDLSSLKAKDPIQLVDGEISVKDASESQKGAIRVANITEVTTAANVIAAVTPKQAKDIADISGLGSGQKWFTYGRDLRPLNGRFKNSTGKAIEVKIAGLGFLDVYVDGEKIDKSGTSAPGGSYPQFAQSTFIVPNGSEYGLQYYNLQANTIIWAELRGSK